TAKELEQPGWHKVRRVIQEWVLLEYACTFLPTQPNAVVEAVSKGLPISEAQRKQLAAVLHLDPATLAPAGGGDRGTAAGATERRDTPPPAGLVPFTPWSTIEKQVTSRITGIDWNTIVAKVW